MDFASVCQHVQDDWSLREEEPKDVSVFQHKVFSFKKTRRLLKKVEFDHVFKNAKKVTTEKLITLHCQNNLGYARVGFAVSKKNVKTASMRNHLKRLCRESFRKQHLPGVDVVILAKKGFMKAHYQNIENELRCVWKKLSVSFEP